MEEKQKKTTSKKKTTTATKKASKQNESTTAKKASEKKQTKAKKEANIKKQSKPTTEKETKKTTKTSKTKKEEIVKEENKTKKTTKSTPKVKKEKVVEEVKESKAKEEKKKKEEQKKTEKRYIEISIGLILALILIIVLVVVNVKLGKHAYKVITENATINSTTEPTNISISQENGNEVDTENELVKKIAKKITFAPNVVASIYNVGEFNLETIPNHLKLRLAWANTKSEDKLTAMNINGQEIESIEKNTMEQNIKDTFGIDVKYKDESFANTDVIAFSKYAINQGTINYSSDLYTGTKTEFTEKPESPLIYQEIQKVIKYNKKVELYVKVSYMNPENGRYSIYKDFINGQFTGKLLETTSEELFEDYPINIYTGEGTIAIKQNTTLNSIRSQLNAYKYTFALNEATGEYHLSSLEKSEI